MRFELKVLLIGVAILVVVAGGAMIAEYLSR